jgi:flagellar hook assembly protein FlgD
MSGNQTIATGNGGGTIADGSVTGWAGPNPFDPAMDGSMTIHYSVGQGKVTTVTCAIYDQTGDLVTSLAPQSSASGSFSWSGSTTNGTMVANGVYFAVIQAQGSGGSSAVVKIAVVEK